MTNKHVHHDLIVEWAKDPSKVIVQRWLKIADVWIDDIEPTWLTMYEYRFKPEQLRIKSSLTDKELNGIGDVYAKCGNASFSRAVADAAAQRAIDDLTLPHDEWFENHNYWTYSSFLSKYLEDVQSGEL